MSRDVNVILSFATEDFVTPEHDDVLLHLAGSLTSRGLIGNFHLTGQLARTLRRRNRRDVIEALAGHELGYHSNTHGFSPFIAGVFEEHSWDDGLAKVLPSEAKGLRDVEEIVGKRAEYFVLEFIKAPQLICAVRLLGIRLIGYSSIPTFDRAAVRMAGVLCCGNRLLVSLESAPDTPDRLARMKRSFDQIYERARAGENDGVIRPFLHPYKLNTYPRRSWGLINQAYQRDPRRDEGWTVPDRLPPEVTRRLLAEHDAMLDYMKAKPGVRFVPMSSLQRMFPENAPRFVPMAAVVELAGAVRERAKAVVRDSISYSPAETYALLVAALSDFRAQGKLPDAVRFRFCLGPVDDAPAPGDARQVAAREFLDACEAEDRRIDFHERMSSSVECGGQRFGPGAILGAAAFLVQQIAESGSAPTAVSLTPRPDLPEAADDAYFQEQTFHRPGIYPDGFAGANICRYCRLQSWSVKPAVRA